MVFNSFQFAVFFIVVVLIYWSIRSNKNIRILFLTVASYYFYMSWNWKFAGLILFSTVLDFIAGSKIYNSKNNNHRKYWLYASLIGNLGALGFFKYFNFFAENFKNLFDILGLSLSINQWNIILPVGISFYTFQTLSYTIDIYRDKLEPTKNFFNFALFVSFFPQLVAGPIVRAKDFLPQINYEPRFSDRDAINGFQQIFAGLFKKIVIGDAIAVSLVDPAFNDPSSFSGLALLFAVYGYAMQIYCDFSGYSDVAIGAAKILGFKLPLNFNRPYLATSITDFWRRWHISLSSWLRDYLYIPLGGNRKGKKRTYINLSLTMLLGGLWHGAAWNFVLWGGMHGLFLAAEKFFIKNMDKIQQDSIHTFIKRFLTFHLVCLSWILFRSSTAEDGFIIIKRILFMSEGINGLSIQFLLPLALGYLLHFSSSKIKDSLSRSYSKYPILLQAGIASILLFIFMLLNVDNSPFIYFQF